jgi:hypothetical protein
MTWKRVTRFPREPERLLPRESRGRDAGEGQQGLDHRVNDRLGAFLAKKRSEHK